MNYFNQCAPQQCTYTTKDMTNLSYAIAIFIGLYGGLTAVLRFLASSFVPLLNSIKNRLISTQFDRGRLIMFFTESIDMFRRRSH